MGGIALTAAGLEVRALDPNRPNELKSRFFKVFRPLDGN